MEENEQEVEFKKISVKTSKMAYLINALNYARTTNNLTLERDVQAVVEKEIREYAPVGTSQKSIEIRQG